MSGWFAAGKRCVTLVPVLVLVLLAGCASGPGGGQRLSANDVSLFNQAMAAVEAGDEEKGISLLTELTGRSRASAVPFINLAILHSGRDELESAEKYFLMALEIEPHNPVANNEYGLLLRKQGQFVEAKQTYEQILKRYPEFAIANKNLGVLCDIYLRDYACALQAYQAYSAVMPDDEEAQVWISDLQWRVGN